MSFREELKAFWRTWLFFLTPVLLLPIPLIFPGKEGVCGYAVLIMTVYWLTEALPLAVTALLPMVLFPPLGILPARDVALNYVKDITFVFMGGLIMAVSVENSNLHSRVALKGLMLMGSKPRWLMLGFMLPTWFLSMWISNTAATAMMVPVVEAVLAQLKVSLRLTKLAVLSAENTDGCKPQGYERVRSEEADTCRKQSHQHRSLRKSEISDSTENNFHIVVMEEAPGSKVTGLEGVDDEIVAEPTDELVPKTTTDEPIDDKLEMAPKTPLEKLLDEKLDRQMSRVCKMMSMCVYYAANVGGTATLTGTPPNLILYNMADQLYSDRGLESPLTWVSWVPYGLPISVLCLLLAWGWLQILYLDCRDCICCDGKQHQATKDDKVESIVRKEYAKLGSMRFDEYANLAWFALLVLLWFVRNPGFGKGYAALFVPGYVTDSAPAILIAVCLMAFPSRRPTSRICGGGNAKPVRVTSLMTWDIAASRVPWGATFLFGGGFALADACVKSGLSASIAGSMQMLDRLPSWALVLVITTVIALITELATNTATTTLTLPILAALADGIGVNPLYLMLPATMAASLAFMLPVATIPNAIVFSYGHLRVIDMVMAGSLMNILCVLVITIVGTTWAVALFDLQSASWISGTTNATLLNTTTAEAWASLTTEMNLLNMTLTKRP